MELRFARFDRAPFAGKLVYRRRDHSFDFVSAQRETRTAQMSLGMSFGTLEISADRATGQVLYVWGYHPEADWQQVKQRPDNLISVALSVDMVDLPPPGVAIQLASHDALTTTFDPETGWVRISRGEMGNPGAFFEFATGCAAELIGSILGSLWLHPSFES